jgi:hypothetical protein
MFRRDPTSASRFLQPDPIGFKGDASNLYRYCDNDPVDGRDPFGLEMEVASTISGKTNTVANWGVKYTFSASTGTNNLANVAGTKNNGPIPPGTYSIYERKGGLPVGDHISKAWILDRNDQKRGNDQVDDLPKEKGGGRFGFRFHEKVVGVPNLGSTGCAVASKAAVEIFAKAAASTSKGPSAHITSPPDKPGDPPTDFGRLPRIGTWKVGK